MKKPKLTDYEQQQLMAIREWRDESPGLVTQALGIVTTPVATTAQRVVPTAALRLALQTVQKAGTRTAARRALLKRADVQELTELREGELEVCDRLTAHVRRRGAALAGGSGAVFGIAGGLGLVADVPTLLLQTFRVIHRVGLCYGEDCDGGDEQNRRLPIAVFALASANSMDEKLAALDAIRHSTEAEASAWREGLDRAAQRELAKEAAVFSLNNLAKTVGKRLGLRKAAGGVPVFGALVGGAVNAWYLNDVAIAAQRTFQMRWLWRKYGVDVGELPALPDPAA